MWNRGFGRLSRSAANACGLCGNTRMDHHRGFAGTRRHDFITKSSLRALPPDEQLAMAGKYAEAEHAVLRCPHGNALRDAAGKDLQVACGCRFQKI